MLTTEGWATLSDEASDADGRGVLDLSIVIVNRNTHVLLEECLASIEHVPDSVRREVIVVDNGSTDGSTELVETCFPNVRLIQNEENTGYAAPNNQGMEASTGRYVLLLNSDTVVLPGTLDRLVQFMDDNPEAGACGPRLSYPDGRLQRSCFSFPSPRSYFARMLMLDALFPRSRAFGNQNLGFDYERTAPVDALLGAALLVRREVLKAVGVLDERFRIHYNDFDWCYRIRLSGWQVYYVHDATIVHYSAVTTEAENVDLRLQGQLVENLFDYHRKHFGELGVRWVRFCTFVGFGVRYLFFAGVYQIRPSSRNPVRTRFRKGMLRAAWTGEADQFS